MIKLHRWDSAIKEHIRSMKWDEVCVRELAKHGIKGMKISDGYLWNKGI